jgi:threonine dehydratase
MQLPTRDVLEKAACLVHDVMLPTPQICWPLLCQSIGAEVWVKHENHTPCGAFKLRGGLVYFDQLQHRHPNVTGVIAATRGNHGQSVAFGAQRHGLRAVVIVPHGNSVEKNAAMRSRQVELIEHGDDFQAAFEYASQLAQERGLHLVPSFDILLVNGVASFSLELLQTVRDIDVLYVPIGLGSGICGAIAVRDALGLKTEIVGVTASAAPAYAKSIAAGKPIAAPVAPTVADGMACRVPDPEALAVIQRGVARIVSVEETEIRSAMRQLFTDTHNVAEGSGAAAWAAAIKDREKIQGRRIAVVQTGGNVDKAVFSKVLAEDA